MNLADNLPPFLSKNDFKVQMNFYAENIWIFNASVIGRILDTTKSNGKKI